MVNAIRKLMGYVHCVESGTDANGWYYQKWSDGYMWAEKTEIISTRALSGSAVPYYAYIYYPAPPVGMINAIIKPEIGNNFLEQAWISGREATRYRYNTTNQNITYTGPINYRATGRWR